MTIRNSLHFTILIKTIAVAAVPFVLVLIALVWMGQLDFSYFVYAVLALIAIVAAAVIPFLNNVAALTVYVNDLAQDKRVRAPELRWLSYVGDLPQALSRLQRSFDQQKQQMETVIAEREILVDTLPDILIMTNNEKVVVRTNRAARNVFGQNLAGKKIGDIVSSEKFINAIDIVIEDFHAQIVEFYLEEPINRDFQAVVERFPIPSQGGISIIITLNDITQQKRIQRMRADFVANASHEIRTPLASIIGFIETLRGPAKDDPFAREEFLKVMAEQAERMSKLVNDLLSLSKIEMNAHNPPTGKVDLLRIIRSEKQHFDWPVQQKKLRLVLKLNEQLPPVRGEEEELAQVVRNLLGNAVKYTNAESDVVVTAKIVTQLPNDPLMRKLQRAVLFSVQDQGEGIAKEHIPRLTERFYRVDSARTRKVGGTGLGLAIVKHVLNRHQGVMEIESELGQGSTFSVYLPVYEERSGEMTKSADV